MNKIIVQWQDWARTTIEHLVLWEEPNQIVAEAAIVGSSNDGPFAARYKISCDCSWRVKKVEIAEFSSVHAANSRMR